MQQNFLTLNPRQISGKRILMREDFNVPISNGVVQNDLRIHAAVPGIKQALSANGQVLLMSHLGRPVAGLWQEEYSLYPVALCLEKILGIPVKFVKNWFNAAIQPEDKLVLLENVRFLPGEIENDPALARNMAAMCDIFVMDAFGSAHRAHASTVGVANYAPMSVAGPLLEAEVNALDQIMQNHKHPAVAVIGGAKVSTKLEVLQSLVTTVDVLLVGGGMANTMLAAQGYEVGASLCEPSLIPEAKKLFNIASAHKCKILLPIDVLTQNGSVRDLNTIAVNDQIMDVGPRTIQSYSTEIMRAATVLWNGPLGVFEDPRFASGTMQVAQAIADCEAFTVAGGGDTLSAIDKFNLTKKISYISTGGGAFLEYIEGKTLPAIQALINKAGKQENYVKTN